MLQRAKSIIGDFLPALRSRNYRLYFIGQSISLIGWWMASVAQQWLIYPTLTNDRSLLGIVGFAGLFPTAAFVLLGGVVADRINLRRGMIVQQMLYMITAFIMTVLIVTGNVQVWHVVMSAFLNGIIFAFDIPTRQSLIISLVPRHVIPSALSLNAGIFNVGRALGSAAGGLVIATLGLGAAYGINGITFLAVIGGVMAMQLVSQRQTVVAPTSLRGNFMEGVRYVRNHGAIASLLLLLFVASVATWPIGTLLPVYAHDIFKLGEIGFGMLTSAYGVGAALGAFGFSKLFEASVKKDRLLYVLVTGVFFYVVAFSVSSVFVLSVLLQIIGGYLVTSLIAFVNVSVQLDAPDTMRGRLLSFYSFVLMGGGPVGSLIASGGVVTLGPRYTLLAGALVYALTSFMLVLKARSSLKEKFAAML